MVLMWIRHLFLGFCGLAAGVGVSAGTFAFLLVIGIIPRLVGKCNRAADALHFENAVILGGICGNLLSVFPQISLPLGVPVLYFYGISAGIFVGCMAVALAEILNTFPIMFRRTKLKTGLEWIMLAMALGKMTGSLYYFLGGLQ